MKFIFKTSLIALLFLTACAVKNTKIESEPSNEANILQTSPPSLNKVNFDNALKLLVDEMIKDFSEETKTPLLVVYPNNKTNQYVSTTNINNKLRSYLAPSDQFNILDKKVINQAKQQLSIPYDDANVSQKKLIALAKFINARYVLFTYINELPNELDDMANITIELIDVLNDEIVWHKNSIKLRELNDQKTHKSECDELNNEATNE